MVRTLFVKIFLWFWLAMAMIVVAIVVATEMAQSDPMSAPGRNLIANVLPVFSQAATDAFEQGGRQALNNYLDRLERTTHLRAAMFNQQGKEVSARVVPPGAQDLIARVGENGGAEFRFSGRTLVAAQPVTGSHGARYIFVLELWRSALDRLRVNPRAMVMRLIAMLLTAGVLCYGLARYLTAPITNVRTATQQLAGGDLSARVGAAVGQRHDELADLGRDFDLMAERLQSLVRAQRALLSDVSHELRSPLARLNVALELARQRAGGEVSGALDRIQREAEQLNELISELLTLARLESGAEEQEKAPVDLEQLVQEIGADADFEARSRNRGVRVVINQACETIGCVDLLRSAIENIVRNAVRYTAEGTTVEIALSCRPDGGSSQAVIRVRDYGPGVPEASLAHLFRPFYRVADARDRESGGTGLGLAIAQRAVRVHDGCITASNAPGGGLLVQTYLPAKTKRSETAPA